jgi:hypothetical protein
MSRVTRHLRVGTTTVLLLIFGFVPLQVLADPAVIEPASDDADVSSLIITEFQTNGGSASQEFIELHNTSAADILLGDGKTSADHYKLIFYGSAAIKNNQPAWTTAPTASIVLKGTVPAYGYQVFSTTGYLPQGITLSQEQHYGTASTNYMTDSGGALQLARVTPAPVAGQEVLDGLAWLDPAKNPTGNVLSTPGKGLSQQRHPFEDDTYIDGAGGIASFGGASEITPLSAWIAPVVEVEPPVPPATEAGEGTPGPNPETSPPDMPEPASSISNEGLASPTITELLPNPAAPAKDEADEYIELFNPNNAAFSLNGYTLQVGVTTLREFVFAENTVIEPQSYKAFYASETRLSLTNTGSQVRLVDPAGAVLSETTPYGAAAEGLAWSLSNGSWQWSATATAGQANTITAAAGGAAARVLAAKSAAKKPAATKTSAKTAAAKAKGSTKTKAAKAKKAKTQKAAKPKTAAVAQTGEKEPRSPIHTGVLVAVVAVAVLYAAYEYRHDIANRFYRLRGDRTVRAFARH